MEPSWKRGGGYPDVAIFPSNCETLALRGAETLREVLGEIEVCVVSSGLRLQRERVTSRDAEGSIGLARCLDLLEADILSFRVLPGRA